MLQALENRSVAPPPFEVDSLALRCPRCGGNLIRCDVEAMSDEPRYECKECLFTMRLENGIWRALQPARVAYFSQFVNDYQCIRTAEGRGSEQADYYLNLPYRDTSGQNSAQWKIRARTYQCLSRRLLPEIFAGAQGAPRIMDVGAGNGWLSYRLAKQGFRPVAIDILVNDQDGLGAATHYSRDLPSLFPRFQAESTRLPFADRLFDAVIFNASFHYAEDYGTSLQEALRCTRAGGAIIIADSPWYADGASGEKMIIERRAAFLQRFGIASDSIASLAYLTDDRLSDLERTCGIQWQRHTPNYGLRWALRPFIAKLRGRREPARFRIYTARKIA
jgi:SAM-dependent methyltransferase